MQLAHLSIGHLGNKPHLENIDSDIKSAPTTVKVPQGIPSSLLFTPLLAYNLYNYTATTAAALDAALLSRPPDEKRASFSTETTPCLLTQIPSQPSSAVATTQLCLGDSREYPRVVSTPTESNLPSRQPCMRLDIYFYTLNLLYNDLP